MIDFKIATNTRFTVGIDFYKRIYYVLQKNNGLIKISNVLTGKTLFDNFNPEEISINGSPMISVNDLQNVVYNRSCYCDPDKDDEDYQIFDDSFPNEFE